MDVFYFAPAGTSVQSDVRMNTPGAKPLRFQLLEVLRSLVSNGWKFTVAVWAVSLIEANAAELPETGDADTTFAKFDATLRGFLTSNDVGAAVGAIARNGEILHLRAFGWNDVTRRSPLPVTTRFRIASVSKPVTAAAMKTLIRDGKLSEETKLRDVLKSPWPEPKDPRWNDITIGHLLEHKGAVVVELTIFGRPVPVELEYWQVDEA